MFLIVLTHLHNEQLLNATNTYCSYQETLDYSLLKKREKFGQFFMIKY